MTEDPKVEEFYRNPTPHREALAALRSILRQTALREDFKWRSPCYTYGGGNVCTVWALKDSAGLGFFKGVLLSDPDGLLRPPGENSRTMRVVRFADRAAIARAEPAIRAAIEEAIQLEKDGRKVDLPKDDIAYPDELTAALDGDPELAEAFEALTPGRRRGYALHFAQPRQSATRLSRIEKARQRIFEGRGLHDR